MKSADDDEQAGRGYDAQAARGYDAQVARGYDAQAARGYDEQAARQLVARMTVEEKASLCSGRDVWSTKPIDRLGVPSVLVTDGPHGVRLETDQLGLGEARPATCFPTASALATTWDRELVAAVGAAIAEECLEFGVGVLLGPGVNVKRSPLGGRNFEYFSEDPLLAGELAAAFIDGVQSRGVGTSLKHLAGNDQETRRMTIDAIYDERTLRELELAGFERALTRARPWTVMAAYNRLNGVYACEHPWLLTEMLRETWGHTGIVVSDWGATNDRVAGLAAGLDLQMPASDGGSDAAIVAAVRDGHLDEAVLDATAARLVDLALRAATTPRPDAPFDRDVHHALARRVAAAAVVLCRNEAAALPIRADDRLALLGAFATEPRYQGTGSSRVNPTRLDTLEAELRRLVGSDRLTYQPGYDDPERSDDALVAAAVRAASQADVAVVCVGLPDGHENEGNDRTHLRLPPAHDALVAALAAVHDRVVVVLMNGAPVAMPWVEDVAAIVEAYLGGQAGGGGLADVLSGAVTPRGKLAETFPRHLDDVPATRHAPGGPNTVEHREGMYVGYRFHATVAGEVLFPFGHGLSYTSFAYGRVALDVETITAQELAGGTTVGVTVEITNTGEVAGTEVVQVYVRDLEAAVYRPDRELRGFATVTLEPGASAPVTVTLGRRAFAFYDVEAADWTVEPGVFEVLVGASSQDVRGRVSVTVTGESLPPRHEPMVYRRPRRYLDVDAASYQALLGRPLPPNPGFPPPYDRNTPIAEVADSPVGKVVAALAERQLRASFGPGPANEALVTSLATEAPLRTLLMGGVTEAQLDMLVDLVNGNWVAGGHRLLRELRDQLGRWRPVGR
jgi:beta-glucosidase